MEYPNRFNNAGRILEHLKALLKWDTVGSHLGSVYVTAHHFWRNCAFFGIEIIYIFLLLTYLQNLVFREVYHIPR